MERDPTYEIFERYVAPVLPFAFLAAVVGIGRIRDNLAIHRLGAAKDENAAAPAVLSPLLPSASGGGEG